MSTPYDLTAPAPHGADETRRRLLAADPFPLPAPTLDLQTPVDGPTIPWAPDDELRREMARLEAGYPAAPPPLGLSQTPYPVAPNGYSPLASAFIPPTGDAASLKAENEEMHKLIEEMKLIFQQATSQEEAATKTIGELRGQMADLERQVQERDDHVTMLTSQITELEKHIQEMPSAPPPPPTEDELAKLADELEKERCSLGKDRKAFELDRQQLKEDEDSLMTQMRQMEVQMAKERADLARQRTDLQRLHADVRHELDQLQRGDGALRDRLVQFQRRHQAVMDRGDHGTFEAAPVAAAVAEPAPSENGHAEGGLFKRLFGRQ